MDSVRQKQHNELLIITTLIIVLMVVVATFITVVSISRNQAVNDFRTKAADKPTDAVKKAQVLTEAAENINCAVCDFNNNGQVDTTDIEQLSICLADRAMHNYCIGSDVNGDGIVDNNDLDMAVNNKMEKSKIQNISLCLKSLLSGANPETINDPVCTAYSNLDGKFDNSDLAGCIKDCFVQ